MIVKYGNIVGLRVFRFLKWQLEVYFCPSGSVIPPHIHRHCDSVITFLGGRMSWRMGDKGRLLDWRDIGWTKRIPAGCSHSGIVVGSFGLFSNLETWDCEPSSASTDLVLV